MQRNEAYAFTCPHAFPEMVTRLNALGRQEWGIGDSYWYGDYLKVWQYMGAGDRVRLRIYEITVDDRPYVLEIIFESAAADAEVAWQALSHYLLHEALPALKAVDIIPTATID